MRNRKPLFPSLTRTSLSSKETNPNIEITGLGNIVIKEGHRVGFQDILYITGQIIYQGFTKKYEKLSYPFIQNNQEFIEECLLTLQQERQPGVDTIEIMTTSSRDRYIIYKLCEFLGISSKMIDRKSTKTMECRDFSDSGFHCGCSNVPARIKKYEVGLDWDNRFCQYEIPWTWKIGVRVSFA